MSKISQLASTREAVLQVAMLYKTRGSPARYPQHIKPRNSQCKAPRLFLKVFKAAKWQKPSPSINPIISSNAWAHHSSIRNVSSATSALVAPEIQERLYTACRLFVANLSVSFVGSRENVYSIHGPGKFQVPTLQT